MANLILNKRQVVKWVNNNGELQPKANWGRNVSRSLQTEELTSCEIAIVNRSAHLRRSLGVNLGRRPRKSMNDSIHDRRRTEITYYSNQTPQRRVFALPPRWLHVKPQQLQASGVHRATPAILGQIVRCIHHNFPPLNFEKVFWVRSILWWR